MRHPRRRGSAEATAIQEKLLAEAAGIAEKAASMKALDDASREHEEFRLRLDKERDVELETHPREGHRRSAQAEVLAQAFTNAKFNIVGGDGAFFDRFVKAVSVGQAIDGAVDQSETLRTVVGDYLNGDEEPARGPEAARRATRARARGVGRRRCPGCSRRSSRAPTTTGRRSSRPSPRRRGSSASTSSARRTPRT